jgi:hypothetical protein
VKNSGKIIPHFIAVMAFVVFIVLGIGSASTPSVDRDTRNQINELARSRNQDMFMRPAVEGEIILGTYQDTMEKTGTATLSEQEAQAFQNQRVLPNYNRPTFERWETAARLMIKAHQEFPDIKIEELDVRSMAQVGDVRVQTLLNPVPIPQLIRTNPPQPPRFSFQATEHFTFSGVVVRRSSEIIN